MKIFISNKSGVIGILTAMVMGFAMVMVAVSLVMTGISSRANAFTLSQSENALISTEGCAEEALVQLSRNHDYVGGSFFLGETSCVVTVQGLGELRSISVVGSHGTITHNLSIQVSFLPTFHITQWAG